jgi:S1-C subfamily serine protease
VAFIAKIAKGKAPLGLILAVALLACPAFFAPARASNAPRMDAALNHLLDAQSASDQTQEAAALNAALQALTRATNKKKGPALLLVQSAISDLNNNDAAKANDDITQAIAAIREAVGSDSDTSTPANPDTTSAQNTTPPVALTDDQARAVVLISGDNAQGTGFMIKTPGGPAILTNIHLIANNPNLKITTNTGGFVTMLSEKGASDRDLALLAIKDAGYKYLEMAGDISQIAQPGDAVVTPGNSQGVDVLLNTGGKILGIGPERIEFSNPIYHGNSGGPVLHTKSGKVLGVVTEEMKIDLTNGLDKASFASRSSALNGSTRCFGLRLDTVSSWVPIDSKRIQAETAFLDQFAQRSRCLDSYLNAPNGRRPEDTLWTKDVKIVSANQTYTDQAAGADSSQRMDAARVLYGELRDLANQDFDTIQNPNSLYSFDQQRTQDEIAYRKAIKAELDSIGDNPSRLIFLARTNN